MAPIGIATKMADFQKKSRRSIEKVQRGKGEKGGKKEPVTGGTDGGKWDG